MWNYVYIERQREKKKYMYTSKHVIVKTYIHCKKLIYRNSCNVWYTMYGKFKKCPVYSQ